MYEHEDGNRARRGAAALTLGAPADESDARARARRALQDAYDWRDDEPAAHASASTGKPRGADSVASISRTVGV